MDWFADKAHESVLASQREPIPVPTECGACGSTRLFIGGDSVKCKDCCAAVSLSNRVEDQTSAAERLEEEKRLLKEAGGQRGLVKQGLF
jgi:hypothetical protein